MRLARRAVVGVLSALMVLGLLPIAAFAAAPVATSKSVSTAEDTLLPITLNGTDPDGDPLTFAVGSGPTHGSLGLLGAPDCTVVVSSSCSAAVDYTPALNYNGPDSFTFSVDDGVDGPDTATITITVTAVNDPPNAVADPTNPVVEDTTTTLNVLTNDLDPENDNFTITGRTQGSKGAVSIIGNGKKLSYDPNLNATGTDSFDYTINDGHGLTDTATVTVQITPVNDPPVAVNDSATVAEDSTGTVIDVLDNDTDVDGPSLTVVDKTNPGHGTLTLIAGVLTYTPTANYNGPDSFTYTVSDGSLTDIGTVNLTVSPATDPPVAVDDVKTVAEDSGPSVVSVLGNDTDPDSVTLTVVAKTDPAHGTLTLVAGVLTYTPVPNYNGPDSFTYTVSDGAQTDIGSVAVTVTPVNDPPVAAADSITVGEDSAPGTVAVIGNDTDIDGDTLSVTAKTDPAHGTLTLIGGELTYAPALDYNGPDSFTYTVSDGALTDAATVSITVTPVNDPPLATDDAATVARDATATVIGVLANDTDADGDTILITGKTNGTKGTVAITGGGTGLTYDPFTGFSGLDSFTYSISDGHGGTGSATVTINITGANRPPNAVNDVGLTVPEGAGATAFDVLANDDDPDGDTFSIVSRTSPAHGTVVITGGGTGLTYDPVSLFHGTDSFTYTIRDAGGATDTATVVVTVTKDTAPPILVTPAERYIGQTVASSTVKVRIAWSATDAGSGIRSYQLQQSVNGGTYATIALASPTTKYVDRALTTGANSRYRVRATDREGNVGAYRYTPRFTSIRYQEATSLATYTGAWSTYKSTSVLGGSDRYTGSSSKEVAFTTTMSDLALVVTRFSTSGYADIYVDGVLASHLNLRASSTSFRKLLWARHFDTLAAHTIEVRPVGNGRVDVDAFLVLR